MKSILVKIKNKDNELVSAFYRKDVLSESLLGDVVAGSAEHGLHLISQLLTYYSACSSENITLLQAVRMLEYSGATLKNSDLRAMKLHFTKQSFAQAKVSPNIAVTVHEMNLQMMYADARVILDFEDQLVTMSIYKATTKREYIEIKKAIGEDGKEKHSKLPYISHLSKGVNRLPFKKFYIVQQQLLKGFSEGHTQFKTITGEVLNFNH